MKCCFRSSVCLRGQCTAHWASQVAPLVVKKLPASPGDKRDLGSIPGSGRSLGGVMATHSSILAWGIPWTEEPGGLQCIGLKRVGHNWSDLACMHSHCILWGHLDDQWLSLLMIHPRHWPSRFPVHLGWHVILSALRLSEDTLTCLQTSCPLSLGLGGLCPRLWALHNWQLWLVSSFLRTFIETFQPVRYWLDVVCSNMNLEKENKHDRRSVCAVVIISDCSLLIYRKVVGFCTLTLYPATLL